jgi:hypothetical protein
MTMRLVLKCDQVDCKATLVSDDFKWGRGMDPFVLALVRSQWGVNFLGELFCVDHRHCTDDPPPKPPTSEKLDP